MDMDVYTFKAPYCDCFYCKVRYDITNEPVGIKLVIRVEMVFIKSTIMKKAIEAASVTSMADGTSKVVA